jgi:hypothetical protein
MSEVPLQRQGDVVLTRRAICASLYTNGKSGVGTSSEARHVGLAAGPGDREQAAPLAGKTKWYTSLLAEEDAAQIVPR